MSRIVAEAVNTSREPYEDWEVYSKAIRMKIQPAIAKLIQDEFVHYRDKGAPSVGDGRIVLSDSTDIAETLGNAFGLNPYIPQQRKNIDSALRVFFDLDESLRLKKSTLSSIIANVISESILLEDTAEDDIDADSEESVLDNASFGDAAYAAINYVDPDADSDNDGVPNRDDADPFVDNSDDWKTASISKLNKLLDAGDDLVAGLYTDPDGESYLKDTDGDGWSDAAEQALGTDPNEKESTPEDKDGDGFADKSVLQRAKDRAERAMNNPRNKRIGAAGAAAAGLAAAGGAISGANQRRKIKKRPSHQLRKRNLKRDA